MRREVGGSEDEFGGTFGFACLVLPGLVPVADPSCLRMTVAKRLQAGVEASRTYFVGGFIAALGMTNAGEGIAFETWG
ncbi:MAG: hypothetical protein WKF81_04250 [Thermomicrobiales bacterium]